MMTPTVIFPALYLGSRELYHSLLSMPGYVLPVVEPGFVERTGYAGGCLVDDFTDVPRLLAALGDWSRSTGRTFGGVLAIDDEDQFETSRAIARHFGLSFYDDATLCAASNKFLMKRRFVRHGVPTGNFLLWDGLDLRAGEGVGFPNVLKTVTGSGSEYVFLNRDTGELADNARYLLDTLRDVRDDPRYREISAPLAGRTRRFDPRREFLLEEYLEGEEYSCDFAVHDGRVRLLRVVKKLGGAFLGSFGGFYLMNTGSAAAEGLDPEDLTSVCGRVARALGVESGVQMVDLVKCRDGLRVLETSIRPGFSIFVALMLRIYGYTSLGVAARLMGGETVNGPIPEDEGLAVYLLADRPGTLKSIDTSGLDAVRGELNVIEVDLYARPGDPVVDSRHDHFDLIQGYVLVKNPGRGQVERVAARVREACVIEVIPAAS